MLNFDTARAVMRLDHQQTLIRAAHAASAADETIWVEWKSSLELTGAMKSHGFFTIAKAILGFANRMPDKALRFAEGHAYILVGVEPGSLKGLEEIDSVELHRGLMTYLGEDGPDYRPTFVPVELGGGTRQVLLVDIAPPRWGDPIYCLRKGYDTTPEGTVFVRQPSGATERARATDFDLLNERARRQDQQVRLAVTVESGQPLRPFEANAQHQAAWLDAEQAALAEVRRQEEAGRRNPARSRMADGDLQRFNADVAAYLAACRKALPEAIVLTAKTRIEPLRLRLGNLTQMNLADVAVELYIPGNVAAARPRGPRVSNDSYSRMPRRPRLHSVIEGRSAFLAELGRTLQLYEPRAPAFHIPALPPPMRRGPIIDNNGSSRIRFDVEHLRPSESVQLDSIVLLFQPPAPDVFEATWSATCKNVDGIVTGQLRLRTTSPAWTIGELLTEPETRE